MYRCYSKDMRLGVALFLVCTFAVSALCAFDQHCLTNHTRQSQIEQTEVSYLQVDGSSEFPHENQWNCSHCAQFSMSNILGFGFGVELFDWEFKIGGPSTFVPSFSPLDFFRPPIHA